MDDGLMRGVVECHGDGILGVSFLQNWLPDDVLVEPTTACLMQKIRVQHTPKVYDATISRCSQDQSDSDSVQEI